MIVALLGLLFPFPVRSNDSIIFPISSEVPELPTDTFFNYTTDGALVKPIPLEMPKIDLTEAVKKTANYDLNGDGWTYCLEFVQAKILSAPRGIEYAKNLITNSDLPAIGAVIKTNESWAGHVGIVVDYDIDTVTLEEYNFISNAYSIRTLTRDDSKILGYWHSPLE